MLVKGAAAVLAVGVVPVLMSWARKAAVRVVMGVGALVCVVLVGGVGAALAMGVVGARRAAGVVVGSREGGGVGAVSGVEGGCGGLR